LRPVRFRKPRGGSMVDRTLKRAGDLPMLLTVDEVAKRLRVKSSWVYGHADALGAFRLGENI
jgi:hypothetical protein